MPSGVSRNVALVTGGRIALLALLFAANVLIIRALGPVAFGAYALCIACVKIFSGCLGDALDLAVMRQVPVQLRSDPLKAHEVLRAAFWVRTAIGAAVLVLAAAFPGLWGHALGLESPGKLVLLTAVAILGDLSLRSVAGYLQASQQFGRFMLIDTVQQVGRFLAVVVLLPLGMLTTTSALAVYAIAPFVTCALGLLFVPVELLRPRRPHPGELWDILHYTKWMTLAMGMAAIFERLDILMLGHFRGQAEMGLFAAALTLATIPDFIGGCLSTALQPRIAEVQARGEFGAFFKKYLKYVGPIAVVALIGAVTVGGWFVQAFLSAKYAQSVGAFRVLVVGSIVCAVLTPLPSALIAFVAPRRMPLITGLGLVLVTVAGLFAIPRYGYMGAAVMIVSVRLTLAGLILLQARALYRTKPIAPPRQLKGDHDNELSMAVAVAAEPQP